MPIIVGSFDGKVINVGSLSLAEEIPVTLGFDRLTVTINVGKFS